MAGLSSLVLFRDTDTQTSVTSLSQSRQTWQVPIEIYSY